MTVEQVTEHLIKCKDSGLYNKNSLKLIFTGYALVYRKDNPDIVRSWDAIFQGEKAKKLPNFTGLKVANVTTDRRDHKFDDDGTCLTCFDDIPKPKAKTKEKSEFEKKIEGKDPFDVIEMCESTDEFRALLRILTNGNQTEIGLQLRVFHTAYFGNDPEPHDEAEISIDDYRENIMQKILDFIEEIKERKREIEQSNKEVMEQQKAIAAKRDKIKDMAGV